MASDLAAEMVSTMERIKSIVRRGDDLTPYINHCSKSIRILNLALKKAENVGTKVSILFLWL